MKITNKWKKVEMKLNQNRNKNRNKTATNCDSSNDKINN